MHPISFEANVNLQELFLNIYFSEMNDTALFVQSGLLPLLNTISSKDLKGIKLILSRGDQWETDALLNAFDPEVCTQIDELLAEGHSPSCDTCYYTFLDSILNRMTRKGLGFTQRSVRVFLN